MKLLFSKVLFFLLTLSSLAVAHSGNKVYYSIQPLADSTVGVTVKLHEHEIAGLLSRERSCSDDQDVLICATSYIQKHLTFTINGTRMQMEPQGTSSTTHDLILRFRIRIAPYQIDTITIQNSCFVASLPQIENVVRILLKDDALYSMTKDRTTVTHIMKHQP